MPKDSELDVNRKLDVVIWLMLDRQFPSTTEKIIKLNELGLTSGEVGALIGKPGNYVTAVLSKKKGKK